MSDENKNNKCTPIARGEEIRKNAKEEKKYKAILWTLGLPDKLAHAMSILEQTDYGQQLVDLIKNKIVKPSIQFGDIVVEYEQDRIIQRPSTSTGEVIIELAYCLCRCKLDLEDTPQNKAWEPGSGKIRHRVFDAIAQTVAIQLACELQEKDLPEAYEESVQFNDLSDLYEAYEKTQRKKPIEIFLQWFKKEQRVNVSDAMHSFESMAEFSVVSVDRISGPAWDASPKGISILLRRFGLLENGAPDITDEQMAIIAGNPEKPIDPKASMQKGLRLL